MMNKKISTLLQTLGLNTLEIDCYFLLLQKSPQKASEIARKIEAPKATILLALEKLSNKFQIVKRIKRKNTFLFFVEDPADVLSFITQQQERLQTQAQQVQQLLPELRAMQQYETVKPKIYYCEGKDGLQKVFSQVLEEADRIIGYGSHEDDLRFLPKVYPDYYQKRVAKKIPVKAIIPATSFNVQYTLENEKSQLRLSHFIPQEFNYPIQVNIYKNTVIFFSFEENFSLVIKSKPIADCLQKMFELAFEYSKESDQIIRKDKK